MVELDEKQFIKSLNGGGRYSVAAIASQDIYLLNEAVDAASNVGGTRTLISVDAQTLNIDELEERAETAVFFGDSDYVYLFDGDTLSALNENAIKRLETIFLSLPEHITFIIRCTAEMRHPAVPKAAKRLCEASKSSASVLILQKTGSELRKHIEQMAAKLNCGISPDAGSLVASRSTGDLSFAWNEIQKAAAHCAYKAIDVEDLDLLAPLNVESGVFDMIRMLDSGNASGAVTALESMLCSKQEPIVIAAALNNNYILMYRAALIKKSGGRLDDLYGLYGYRKTDVKPKIAFEKCGRRLDGRYEKIIEVLHTLDAALKGSKAESRILLEAAVCRIARLN